MKTGTKVMIGAGVVALGVGGYLLYNYFSRGTGALTRNAQIALQSRRPVYSVTTPRGMKSTV